MRIERLARENQSSQGSAKRAWYQRASPAHLEAIFGTTLTGATREAIGDSPQALRPALILGSPDFMRR